MEGMYKLHVRLGNAEFNAEGPESTVKEAFDRFLQAVSSPAAKSLVADLAPKPPETPNGPNDEVKEEILKMIFSEEGEMLSLRLLPQDTQTRAADTAILLLYGFKKLKGLEQVPIIKLNQGLRKSGVSVQRIDRIIGVHNQLFMKGGTRSGGRYSLNNQGVSQAEKWIKSMVS